MGLALLAHCESPVTGRFAIYVETVCSHASMNYLESMHKTLSIFSHVTISVWHSNS